MTRRIGMALLWLVAAHPVFADLTGITSSPLAESGGYVSGVTAGPDGAVWFVDSDKNLIGRVPVSGGSVTTFPLPTPNAGLAAITTGPDGNLWFLESAKLGKITTSGTITEYPLTGINIPSDLKAGPDGNLWVVGLSIPKTVVIKFTTTGASAGPVSLPGNPSNVKLAPGPGNAMWFHDRGDNTVGFIGAGGVQSFAFSTPETAGGFRSAGGLAQGPDGNMWVGHSAAIARVTPAGKITEYAVPGGVRITGVAAGADGNIWFVDGGAGKIGRLLLSSATDAGTATIDTAAAGASSPGAIVPIAPTTSAARLSGTVTPSSCPGGEFLVYDEQTPPPHMYIVQLPGGACADLYWGDGTVNFAGLSEDHEGRLSLASLVLYFYNKGPNPVTPTVTGTLSVVGGDPILSFISVDSVQSPCTISGDAITCTAANQIKVNGHGVVAFKFEGSNKIGANVRFTVGSNLPDPVPTNNQIITRVTYSSSGIPHLPPKTNGLAKPAKRR